MQFDRICLTLDVDWARDEILEDVISRIQQAGVKVTIFATHDSAYLKHLMSDHIEIGIHPNFASDIADFRSPILNLKSTYPSARGGRSHGLFVSSNILNLYREFGLVYESNIFLPHHENLHPVLRFDGFTSLPFFWSDDKHIELNRPFDEHEFALYSSGLKIYNFHPIHIYMNTYSVEHYLSYKVHYQDIKGLDSQRNKGQSGIGTLFDKFLQAVRGQDTYTLHQIHQDYLSYAQK